MVRQGVFAREIDEVHTCLTKKLIVQIVFLKKIDWGGIFPRKR